MSFSGGLTGIWRGLDGEGNVGNGQGSTDQKDHGSVAPACICERFKPTDIAGVYLSVRLACPFDGEGRGRWAKAGLEQQSCDAISHAAAHV